MIVHSSLQRIAHTDQLEAEMRDDACCPPSGRCVDCQARFDEVRAARRDVLLHRVATVRPRRPVR